MEIQMEEGKIPTVSNKLLDVSLRPSWYGKVNWGDWRSVSPKLAEEYDKRKKTSNINENVSKYVSPVYDERLEYIKSITQSNTYNTYNKNNTTTTQDKHNIKQDEFIVYNKKGKIHSKEYSRSKDNFDATKYTNADVDTNMDMNMDMDDYAYDIEDQTIYNDTNDADIF